MQNKIKYHNVPSNHNLYLISLNELDLVGNHTHEYQIKPIISFTYDLMVFDLGGTQETLSYINTTGLASKCEEEFEEIFIFNNDLKIITDLNGSIYSKEDFFQISENGLENPKIDKYSKDKLRQLLRA